MPKPSTRPTPLPTTPERRAQPARSPAGPLRTCVGCRRRAPQVELVRIARTLDGGLVADRTAPGRGAWLCAGRPECLDTAERRRAFGRAFRAAPAASAVARLRAALFGNPPENLRDLSVAGPPPDGGTRPMSDR